MAFFFRSFSRPAVGAAAGILGLACVALVFQNCGSYAPVLRDSSYNLSSSGCSGPDCGAAANLMLKVRTNNSEWRVAADQGAFDLGGDCESAGFAQTRVRWSISGPAQSSGASWAGCDEVGRWRILVALPAGGPRGGTVYQLTATLTAVDSTGAEITNPILPLAQQTISVTVN